MGRHGRPEADALAGVDVAAELESGPVIEVASVADDVATADTTPDTGHGRRRAAGATEQPAVPLSKQPAVQVSKQPAVALSKQPAVPLSKQSSEQPAEQLADAAVEDPPVMRATLAGATVIARRDRQAERKARRSATRRRLLLIGSVVVAVLLIAGVAAVVISSRGHDAPPTSAPKTPHQSTLLVQVAGQDGTGVVNALVGVTKSTRDSAALLIPAGLLVDDASSGNMPFGETLTLPAKTASRDALTDLLGVRVSNSWALSQAGLAALVDKVGGVQATVDVDVLAKNAKGEEAVVVRAGSQRLTGAQAAAYASYLADGEPETVRLARFNDVFDGVLRALPGSETGIAAAITGLSTGSTSSLSPAQLASLLVVLRTAAVKETLHYDVLPVNDIDTGDTVDTYGLDSAKTGALLQSLFAASLQKDRTGDIVRVLVENGIGTPDLVTAARTKLVKDGFQFITGGNASDLSSTAASVVLIEDGSAKAQARGARVAKSLGLPTSSIQINPRGQTVADIIVILGADFKP
jgi:anionic cell wall polymer biosynthesis LytR-Cps2A-Psr (LCP) family protein